MEESDLLHGSPQKRGVGRNIWLGTVALCFALAIVVIVLAVRHSSASSCSTAQCNREPTIGTQGMVSTTHYLATQAGLAMLKAGGNAFDAAAVIQGMLTGTLCSVLYIASALTR